MAYLGNIPSPSVIFILSIVIEPLIPISVSSISSISPSLMVSWKVLVLSVTESSSLFINMLSGVKEYEYTV